MKNIAIITFHKSYNYGAFMQCYSLIKKIEKDFPNVEVEVINYTCKSIVLNYQKWLNSLSLRLRQPFIKKKLIKRNNCFDSSQKLLPLSEYCLVSDDYNILFKNIQNKYDVIIVGSDAVWNWNVRGFPNAYFLNANIGAKKLSYAASSFGQDFTQVTNDQKQYLKEAWSNFEYLGVRDKATEDFVKHIDNKLETFHNCDPTVFLDMATIPVDMINLKSKLIKAGVNFNKPLIGLMGNEILGKNIRKIFGGKYQIVAIYEPNRFADVFIFDLTPLEWSKVFSFFSITFTHFFHGTLLSLKNLKPTIIIETSNSYSLKFDTKIVDLLKRLDLSELYYTVEYFEKKGWTILENIVEDLLKNPRSEKIKTELEKEAKNYDSFRNALNKLL